MLLNIIFKEKPLDIFVPVSKHIRAVYHCIIIINSTTSS